MGRKLEQQRIKTVWPYLNGYVLDIGCGMNNLVRQYGNGVGVDVYDWGDVDFVVENTAQLPFENAAFDTVTILAALNHIPNRDEVLLECHRVLADDGLLILTMIPPIISSFWHKIRKPWDVDQNERGMKAKEVYGFTSKQMIALISGGSFELKSSKRFMCGINTVYVCNKSEQKRVISKF
ncbi:MAG: class I SAM-dependent methyltransferase [Proteobacteria bacterium]|nr:class I SAM-dependent methyltransferase [Pseudomonadota bacterium]